MTEKPYLVIGSSQKGLPVAKEIEDKLKDIAEITVWPDLFVPNENYLSTLLVSNLKFDFAIMVFTPDDDLMVKEKSVKSARDNVIFELGLAFGRLGARRSFAVIERSVNIPTDLAGLKLLKFESSDAQPLTVILEPVCKTLREIIEQQFKEPELGLLPSTALAIGYFKNFLEKVCLALLDEVKELDVDGKKWINNKKFNISVLIPEYLAYVDPKQIKFRLQDNNLIEVPIKTGSRPYPLYIKAGVSHDNMLMLYDLPTTLFASMEAIERAIPNNIQNYTEIENQLQIRELRNFKRTLDSLLNRKENLLYKQYITIEYHKTRN